jgi:hypothetical protein
MAADDQLGKPFDSIESAQDFVVLLAESIEEAQAEIRELTAAAQQAGSARREEALQLAAYKLESLAGHTASCRRILNDLRSLRRLLVKES